MIDRKASIFVTGQTGLVGSQVMKTLKEQGYENLILADHANLDLTNQDSTRAFFEKYQPECTIVCAGKVGGIHANNSYPGEFIYENLMMECNTIHQAYSIGCKNLVFLGSSCIYPRLAPQPISEESLTQGSLEPTNEPYAIAKIAGVKLCESYNRQYNVDYRSLMPTNLYGPRDNFHEENSHVLPALLRRIHEAKLKNSDSVVMWGTGSPRREFLYVPDLAKAIVNSLSITEAKWNSVTTPMCSHLNVGCGEDVSILELATLIKEIVGFKGKIELDTTKPDGMPRKLLNVSKINSLGWKAETDLASGISETYQWFLENEQTFKR